MQGADNTLAPTGMPCRSGSVTDVQGCFATSVELSIFQAIDNQIGSSVQENNHVHTRTHTYICSTSTCLPESGRKAM
eukprot:33628-Amphidinium_carterae.1